MQTLSDIELCNLRDATRWIQSCNQFH